MKLTIGGQATTQFEPVRTAFTDLWQNSELGAGLCVYHKGQKVVDLWGGWVDRERSVSWSSNTLVNIYSTTKGLAALAVAILCDEGWLDYDERVAHYWPEFGSAGKAEITVAELLSHQAGLSGVTQAISVLDLCDWDKMVGLLAQQAPLWKPGTKAGYHAITWGYFPGELIKRITGQTLGEYFSQKVAIPLNADCYIGLPDRYHPRCATLNGPNHAPTTHLPGGQTENTINTKTSAIYRSAQLNPIIRPFKDACSKHWRRAEIAAANGHATAAGIAKIYAALANNGQLKDTRIISAKALARALKTEVEGCTDLVLGHEMRRGRGFILNTRAGFGPNPEAFGHNGAGGSTGYADPKENLAVSYVMNQMRTNDGTTKPRAEILNNAIYSCI
ncbi:MAG: beta-lactamase family protein [Gammaproteobacteria bacterium]|jgi:CubicO group peptidase (beta-lactamase class C family)|nr:beta-lactamase family protein [Gammaproteobacteria bacterium]MBT5205073.1 beta-lactamase family protein [Gammaproteobacteria bacterium]MBT5603965.1 beta-lactamase family protein [Gammaproteobacteria bacterium]MBT6244027.1 beta-lactamase family protein [Gammaproteobacteria bacterium]